MANPIVGCLNTLSNFISDICKALIGMQKEEALSTHERNNGQSKSRILRMDTPDPMGDSENYEVVTNSPTGNIVTVYNKHGEPLYFYINKKKSKKDSKLRKKNNKS